MTVARHGVEVALPRRRQRLVLARLLVDAGEVVPARRLLDDIWGSSATSRGGTGPLRNNVWELRGLLRGEDVIVRRDGGYALVVGRDQVDSTCLEDLLHEARGALDRPEWGLARVEAALALRRGPAFGELAGELALQVESARLDELHLTAQELRAQLLLDLGRHDQVAAELGALARATPERERLWASLMTALYRCGRQGDALRCYQEARSRLGDAIGVEPGPEVRQVERAILRHDPALDWRPAPAPADGEQPWLVAGARPHNLPRPLTGLVGRAAERRAVAGSLGQSRLVSLVGPGGCGKTRLAIAVAEDLSPRFCGGVWFVDLAGATGASPIAGVVAAALGNEVGLGSRGATTSGDHGDGEALLVLDNCEHVLDPVADYVAQVLEDAPGLHVLVTSREELRLPGETVCRLAGLALPRLDHDQPYLGSEAVELFVRRGAAALAGFSPGRATLELVGRVCRRLDGLPLAIELAASLVGSLPVAEIARRVEERCTWPAEVARRGLPRHRTVRAAIDGSFDLLDEPLQELFAGLGVFAGSFTTAAAEAVLGRQVAGHDVRSGVGRLAGASLLERVAGPDGVERYRMLETVREYAGDLLDACPDAAELRAAHARHVAAVRVRGR